MVVIRWILKILAILILAIILLWGAVVGIIATPEIITPHIVSALQQQTKSEVSIKSVDLSLFTRFPNITLRIDSLRITQTKDSIDDLIFARQCRVAVDPIALLSKRVQINHLSLRNTNIYMYVDSLNGPLKTFILPEPTEEPTEEEADSLSEFDISDYTLSIRRLKIDSMRIVLDDRTKEFYTRVEDFSLDVSTNISSTVGDLEVKTAFSNLIVWHKGDLLAKRTSMDLRSQMLYDRDSMSITFERARIKLNGIDLKARGTLRRDTTENGVLVDIRSSLNTPSISEFLALVPSSVIDTKDEITTEGEVSFDMDFQGLYSDTSVPTIGATLKIKDAKAKYASRKLSLERVNCDAYMFVDLNEPTKSYADVTSLQVNTSDIIDLNFSGKVSNMIEDPQVDISVTAEIDFDRFTEVFPLNEGITCSGMSHSDLKTSFALSDIESQNFSNLYINGESNFKNLEISFDASKFAQDTSALAYMYMQAESGKMLFGDNVNTNNDSRTLRSVVNFMGLGYQTKTGEYMAIKDIELSAGANFDRATSQVNGFGVRGIAKNMDVGIDSLLSASLESSDVTLVITPKRGDRNATIKAKVASNTIIAKEPNYNSDIKLSTVDMDISLKRNDDVEEVADSVSMRGGGGGEPRGSRGEQQSIEDQQKWSMEGTVAFSDLEMFTDLFPIDVKIPQTSVSMNDKTIFLDNARLRVGESEIIATGKIQNLIRKIFLNPRLGISGELSITAPMVDFSEILEASNSSVLLTYEEEESEEVSEEVVVAEDTNQSDSLKVSERADSLPPSSDIFLVPRRMDFVFDLRIEKARFEEAIIDSLEGRAIIKDGVLLLEKLNLKAIGADASGSLTYRNIDRHNSNVMANMNLAGVDINRIGELIPSVNAMFPMIESFEGVVDFDLKANTNFNSEYEPDISTICSAMRFKGKDLVLMDSETFADLSKTLLFKNKDRNLIDSVEVFVLVSESTIDVLPFSMSIDRYSAIIGGSQVVDPQTFDLNYDYNISIIKSPLPFKAGVDVTGDLEDFKFKVTKAKLKKTDFDAQRVIYNDYRNSIEESSSQLQDQIDAARAAAQAMRREQRAMQMAEAAQQEAEIEAEEEDEGEVVEEGEVSQEG